MKEITIEKNRKTIAKLKRQIAQTEASKAEAITKHGLQLEDPKNLESPEQQKAIAEKL